MINEQILSKWICDGYDETWCKIGSCSICIHHPKQVTVPQYVQIIEGEQSTVRLVEKKIHLWYNPNLGHEFRDEFDECCTKAKTYFPEALSFFYQTLDKEGVSFLPPERHCNRYYQYKEYVLADFPYESDKFYLIADLKKDILYVFGEKTCILRILGDLYAIMQERLPLHGCAVSCNGRASCFLGNSNCGKSTVLMHLMRHGYEYISDDELYIKNNKVYSLEQRIQIRSEWCDPTLRTGENKVTLDVRDYGFRVCSDAQLGEIYVLHNQDSTPFLQWFPCVARQSFWWMMFWEYEELLQRWIQEKTIASTRFAHEMICNAKHVIVDFNMINNQIKKEEFSLDKMFKEVK